MALRGSLVWLVLGLALLVRVVLLPIAYQHPERTLRRDSPVYIAPALNMLDGHGFSVQSTPPYEPDAQRTPIYPLFIASIYALFGRSPVNVSVAQAPLEVMTVAVTYWIGKRLFGTGAALVGALLLALSLGSIIHSLFVLTETLFTFLLILTTLAALFYVARRSLLWLTAMALFTASVILCRPIALFYPAVLLCAVFFAWWRDWRSAFRHGLLYLVIVSALLVPWMWRNQQAVGLFSLSTISSYNLYYYNAASLEADVRDMGTTDVRAEMETRAAEQLNAQGLVDTPANRVRVQSELAMEIIRAAPLRYAIGHLCSDLNSLLPAASDFLEYLGMTTGAKGTLSVLNHRGLVAAVKHYFGDSIWLLYLVAPFVVLLGLTYAAAFFGTVCALVMRDYLSLIILGLPIAYLLLIPGAPANPRFRVPIMPHLCLLAGLGAVGLVQWARHYHQRKNNGE